jgi:hypothetical protein
MRDIFGHSPKQISHTLGIIAFRAAATHAEAVKQPSLFRSGHPQAELFAPEVLKCVQTWLLHDGPSKYAKEFFNTFRDRRMIECQTTAALWGTKDNFPASVH